LLFSDNFQLGRGSYFKLGSNFKLGNNIKWGGSNFKLGSYFKLGNNIKWGSSAEWLVRRTCKLWIASGVSLNTIKISDVFYSKKNSLLSTGWFQKQMRARFTER